jgi:2-oxoglutarate ferredoxin oxidoreductase subunit beta
VTYGQPEQQLKMQKARLEALESLGHDPADRLKAMALAQQYGLKVHTGVFYRDPSPDPSYESYMKERQGELDGRAVPRERILEQFIPDA